MVRLYNDKPDAIISFSRTKNSNRVISIINFSDQEQQVVLKTKYVAGNYKELFSNKPFTLKGDDTVHLQKWDYLVLEKIE